MRNKYPVVNGVDRREGEEREVLLRVCNVTVYYCCRLLDWKIDWFACIITGLAWATSLVFFLT